MRLLSVVIFIFLSLSAYAGHEVNNGGDVVWCPTTGNFYFLDYAVVISDKETRRQVRTVKSLDNSLFIISRLLTEKAPFLSKSFDEFTSLLDNESDLTKPYIWKPVDGDLPEIGDESVARPPSKCASSSFGQFQIYQAVVRKPSEKRVVFYYSPEHVRKLDSTQKSFLIVHEWLWNYVKNSTQNRNLNVFLHSKKFEDISSEEVVKKLAQLGLIF